MTFIKVYLDIQKNTQKNQSIFPYHHLRSKDELMSESHKAFSIDIVIIIILFILFNAYVYFKTALLNEQSFIENISSLIV